MLTALPGTNLIEDAACIVPMFLSDMRPIENVPAPCTSTIVTPDTVIVVGVATSSTISSPLSVCVAGSVTAMVYETLNPCIVQ